MTNHYKKLGGIAFLMLTVSFQLVAQVKPLISKRIIAEDGKPTLIQLDQSRQVPIYEAEVILKEQLNLPKNNIIKLVNSSTDELGVTHQKFQQFYKDVKVEYAVYNAHGQNNSLKLLNGEAKEIANLDVTPSITADAALAKAMQFVGATKYMWQDPEQEKWVKKLEGKNSATFKPKGELVIVDNYLTSSKEAYRKPTLAYKLNVYAMEPVSRNYVYVDAHTGEVVHIEPIIKHATANGTAATRYSGTKTIKTDSNAGSYRLRDYTRGSGIETYDMNTGTNYNSAVDFTDNDNNWTAAEYNNAAKDNAALDAHWGAQMTYDYWSTVHNRNSFDGNGAIIKSYVHYDVNYENAYWNGSVMTYGDGNTRFDALTSLDVAAHEIGHAVMENTANMVYQKESGAMNEGFSDIWGASVEYFAAPNKSTWLIGEDIDKQQAALRSMSDPKSQGQPDTYLGTNWVSVTGCTPSQFNDYCGVHTNSGVLNHWYYILSVGKTGTNDNGTNYAVTGITIDKAAKIAYRAESVYLGANSTYNDARNFTIQAAEDLYGIGSNEVIQTTNAWNAVGVGAKYGEVSYCASNGNNINDEYIGRVQLGTINNATGGTAGGYADYTSISTDLNLSANYTITITPTWTGTVYNEAYGVWIDYNADGDFSDAGEQVFSKAASKTTPVSGSFTIPSTAKPGATRMRVSLKYNAIPTPCESFTYGEVEDYTVNIIGSGPDTTAPSVPTGLTAANITINSVDLSWNASTDNVGVTGYDVYQDGTLIASPTGTSYAVTGLASGTTYAFTVRAKDAAGNTSAQSTAINVTTDTPDTTPPSTPTGLAANSVTQTSFTLSWAAATDNVGVTGYDVYQDGAFVNSTTATSMNITGLTAGTTYAYTVKAKDAAGNVSAASSALNVTTVAPDTTPPSVPTGLAASNVTQTTLTLSWNASSDNVGVTGYDVLQDGTVIGSTASTSYNVTGLTASTTYAFAVKAKDAEGNVSAASSALNVTTQAAVVNYCTASGNSVNYEYIDLVQLGTINNSTGANGGYGDFTNLSTTLVTGSTNTINFSPGFPGSTYSENWKVFIDYNNDGDFADAGEEVVSGSTSNAGTSSGTFTVPAGATLGSTRMRVVMAWNTTPPSCGTYSYGEVEDYTVTISATALNGFANIANYANGETINPDFWTLGLVTYPNPVVSELSFNFNEFKEVKTVRIYNMNGAEMRNYHAQLATNSINVAKFTAGMYVLMVETERGVFETKFMKK